MLFQGSRLKFVADPLGMGVGAGGRPRTLAPSGRRPPDPRFGQAERGGRRSGPAT
jgi:hypothetical protein